MFYIIAFVIGGCARSLPKALLFAIVYVVLYAALLFAMSAQALHGGTTSVPRVLEYLAAYAAIAFAIIAVGYLCRVVIGRRLARAAEEQGDTKAVFD